VNKVKIKLTKTVLSCTPYELTYVGTSCGTNAVEFTLVLHYYSIDKEFVIKSLDIGKDCSGNNIEDVFAQLNSKLKMLTEILEEVNFEDTLHIPVIF
jgi:hypothetical protein